MAKPVVEKASWKPAWRVWWGRVALAVGAPILFLALLEGGLRVAGFGHPTAFFLGREIDGRAVWVDNWQFGWRFFPRAVARMPHPLVMPKQKEPGTMRIFVLGESAAQGVPAPEYGFSRVLGVLLSERFPGRKFEVVNVAMVAINSHAILPIARECARREGDLWVIYMGNNEVIGPFGAYGVLGTKAPPWPVIQANLWFKTTRTGQALEAAGQRLRGPPAFTQWHGMQMWQERIGREDPRVGRVQINFQKNLEAILAAGERANVPMILSTVACNLRDCSPFGSRHGRGLAPEQQPAWEAGFQAGQAREAAGKFAEALEQYRAAAKLDGHYAELQFRLGRCALALGQTAAAREHFQAAKDEDALQFRTDTRLNDLIRQAAAAHAGRGVRLLDAEALFARYAPDGIPGEELFWEHVHLTFAGNYLLAKAAAEMAAESVAGSEGSAAAANAVAWLSQAECEQRLGLTDWGRHQTVGLVQELIGGPPFTTQTIHSNQVEKLRGELRRLRPATRSAGVQGGIRQLKALTARARGDPALPQILAGLFEAAEDFPGAEQRWREVIRLLPHAALPYLNLGRMLAKQNREEEAALAYEECLRRNPDTASAHGDLGELRLRQGRAAEAIAHLQALLRQQPESVPGHFLLGQALARGNRPAAAAAQFEEVLKLEPNHAEARRYLEGMRRKK
jgi:tetratricopeptide (TPR) repeat protein